MILTLLVNGNLALGLVLSVSSKKAASDGDGGGGGGSSILPLIVAPIL